MNGAVIIPCAGSGKRFGNTTKKQYVHIDQHPLFYHTLLPFLSISELHEIILVVPEEDISCVRESIQKLLNNEKRIRIIAGGKERQDSVFNGLSAIQNASFVLVHDGVRPMVTKKLIQECIDATKKYGTCVPGIPLKDTLKEVTDTIVIKTVDRRRYILTQTPQGFSYSLLMNCYKNAQESKKLFTDDASLVESFGHKVYVIPGDEMNIKITTQSDIKLIEYLRSQCV